MSQTVVKLGHVLISRGDFSKLPEGTKFFKDNVLQYNGSAFIAKPSEQYNDGNAGTAAEPLYYLTRVPYNVTPNEPNDGWEVFASDAAYVNSFMFFTENPEWAYVVCDNEDKVLFGAKQDGEFYFGAGCPPQVKSYIEEKISALSLDEYESIVAFLDGLLDSDTTLKMMLNSINEEIQLKSNQTDVQTALEQAAQATQEALNTKVDKEEGKSLIDSEFADVQSHTDSPEFLEVTTDSEDKVLEGIQVDGTKVIGGDLNIGGSANISGDIRVLGNMEVSGVSYNVIENPEYLAAWVDTENKILFGIKTDGKTYVGDADFLNDIKNNQEAINEIKSTLASIGSAIESLDIDALSSITAVENPEFIEAKTDSEGKILSYRDSDGVMHENVGIETSKLTLTEDGLNDFQKTLNKNGIAANDWSNYISEDGDKPLLLPEPRVAYVNFTGSQLPTTKTNNYHAYIEYHDNMGNYFKKKVILNAQGASSIVYNNQKNLSIDLFDSDWDGDAFAVKIGNWVPQDSFHIKTFYMDPIRGLADVCYKYAEYVIQETNTRPNRLAREEEKVTVNGDTGIIENDYDTGALCHPDGFPCLVYHEGEFMGIYAWNLKKNRKNYMMDKKDYESVHIDPAYCNLWNLNPINWESIEIRNPKKLICMDGTEYDGDNPKELIDSTSEYWDNSKDQKNTVKTKNIIVGLHDAVAAINNAATIEEKKALFDQTFDVDGFIVFWIVSQLLDNWDGLRDRNTQWLYYKKSGKWCPSFYDLDNCVGYCGYPWLKEPYNRFVNETSETLVFGWIWDFHKTEIVTLYQELRNKNIISTNAFLKFYNNWYCRVDTSIIKLNAEMWDVPCYRDGKINKEYWKEIGIEVGDNVTYSSNENYNVGDIVTYGIGYYISGSAYVVKFKCVKTCIGEVPCGSYPNMPQTGGVFDSPRRVKIWLDAKIEILDNLIVNN